MDRSQWIHEFVAYMWEMGVQADHRTLNRLAEDLFPAQGHLNPAVVAEVAKEMLPKEKPSRKQPSANQDDSRSATH